MSAIGGKADIRIAVSKSFFDPKAALVHHGTWRRGHRDAAHCACKPLAKPSKSCGRRSGIRKGAQSGSPMNINARSLRHRQDDHRRSQDDDDGRSNRRRAGSPMSQQP